MKRAAFTVREGSSIVRGYKYGHGPDKSARFCLTWYRFKGDKLQRETKTGERAARERAKEIARDLANDQSLITKLSGTARETHLRISAMAAELSLPLFDLVEQAAAAKKVIGRHSLLEAANFFERGYVSRKQMPATAQILRELLDSIADKPRSDRYLKPLKRDLEKFAAAFPDLNPAMASEDAIRDWLRSLELGPRRRDNVRDAVVRLSRFARRKNYLPEDRRSEAEKVERIWEGSDVETFSPDEMAKLLEHVNERWKPWMLLGAYAGLRTTEIFRLDWSAVKLDQKVIAVKRAIARKVRISRLVPIVDNLLAWLEPYRTATGRIYPNDNEKTLERALERELERLEEATGIDWKHNGLRHSFGSHRLAIVKSVDQVAIEMGNSPAKVRENYNDPKTEAEARLYFAHLPPDKIENVIALPTTGG